uniref:Uncharacterized protein n=1 Tax=Gossypium raimondii TaxID=29730 RepID=A0A0D2R3U5_GOSRA|nr:hypothetical protein B456_004G129500 [Gossypium raimondii]
MHAYSPYAAGPLLLHRLVRWNPNPRVIGYPPMQLLRVITITLPHPRFPNPCFPLLCFSVFCPRPQPSDSPTPPCTDTFFIAILPDFAFTRLLFIELFSDFPGYRLVFLPK